MQYSKLKIEYLAITEGGGAATKFSLRMMLLYHLKSRPLTKHVFRVSLDFGKDIGRASWNGDDFARLIWTLKEKRLMNISPNR